MKTQLKYLIPFVIFLMLIGFFLKGLNLDPREVPSPLINKPAPMFEQPLLNDASKTFSSNSMLGQVWLLNVWASWCTACRDEHPLLMAMSQQIDVPIVGIDYKDTNPEALDVLSKLGNPYSVVATDVEGRVGIDYGVYGVPETYLIDKEGVIRYKQIGPITVAALQEKIIPMIKGLK